MASECWTNVLLALLVGERKRLGLAAFMAKTCAAACRRASGRRDRAAAGRWHAETCRWLRAVREARRRDEGGCGGR